MGTNYVLGTELRGDAGQYVSFDGRFVTVSQRGLARLFAGRSEKRIPVSQITSVDLKPPTGPLTGILPGWIRFTTAGSPNAARAGFGSRGYNARHDENTVIIPGKKALPQFLALRDTVEEAISGAAGEPSGL
ncbi:DUF4429 domain-containing protein [Streptomyces griseoruber]|uniref:DUF4429 domain-containing protein n=1 Tax=Streptomyces griseoruber TaxID=1943 RepID=A0A101SKB6_9ACTN|nr:DUF4429 domain-containing protein [Streptomyces griseoruber]KUN75393.1 hypothetical protein AQJ64_42735 [Streptomyces griseoruber]